MKNFILSFVCLAFLTLLASPVTTFAQTDSTTSLSADTGVKAPVLKEATKVDSLFAYAQLVTNPDFKDLLVSTANTIKAGPAENTVEGWYGWIAAVLAAIFGVYQYLTKKKAATTTNTTSNQ